MSTQLDRDINRHQREVDAASERDLAEERIAEDIWVGISKTPSAYANGGCFDAIDFTVEQRATLIRAVAKIRTKDDLSTMYEKSIVSIVFSAVSKIVYDEAMSEYLGSGE